jgi:PAS domain S-box-containing protein
MGSQKKSDASGIPFEFFFRRHDAIMLLLDGENGRIIDANDAALRFYGYSIQQITSMEIGKLNELPSDVLDAERQQATRERQKFFIRSHRLANGEIRAVEVHTTTISIEDTKYLFSVIHDIAERKQAEAELSDLKDRMGFALTASRTGAWDLDLVDHTAFRTLEHDRIFGYDELLPQWTYEMFIEHVLPDDRAEVERKFQKAIQEKGNWDFECRIIRKDGMQRWIWACGQHRQDSLGQFRRMAGIVQDITERKSAEEAILESELHHRTVADFTYDWETWVAPDGRILYSSPSVERITGYSAAELLVDPGLLVTMIHPEDKEILENHYREELTDKEKTFHFDYRTITKQGQQRWVSHFCVPVNDDKGIFLGRRGSTRDITERKRLEARQQLSIDILNKLNTTTTTTTTKDIIREILLLIKKETDFEALGIRLKDSQDYPYFETNGFPKPFVEKECFLCERDDSGNLICDQDGKPLLECMCGNIISGQTNPKLPFFTEGGSFWSNSTTKLLASTTEEDRQTARTRNWCNHEGYESVAIIPLRAGNIIIGLLQLNDRRPGLLTINRINFFEGIGASIGLALCRKQSEEEHEKYEEQLRQNQKLESLGVLAGGIAHDFNNLMSGIFGYIDMAIEESKDAKVTHALTKAVNTIDRARDLTQQLLTFAKGGAPIKKIDNLFPFIQETAQFALSGSTVSCHFDIQPGLWQCNFDKNQIGQVIDNIVINAQQAMPDGGTIEISARNISFVEKEHISLSAGNYVKTSIKDNGIGIPKKILPRIFDPFYTTKPKGHGLGLATCYSIVNRHGGCIEVESEPGQGSTFHVFLPASQEFVSSAIAKSATKHKGSGTFLVMDDEEMVREPAGYMLESLGYTVVFKDNGKDAINFFTAETKANRKIVGMIFDMTIPGGMGGLEAVANIRKINKEIPVFVSSGYAHDTVMNNPTEFGFTASICKPFSKAELAKMLNKYLTPPNAV